MDVQTAWEPAGLALAIGDRVRVRLNGECRCWYPPSDGEPGFWSEHDVEADGRVGTVADVFPQEEAGHVYEVCVDDPWITAVLGGMVFSIHTDQFARAELERLGGADA